MRAGRLDPIRSDGGKNALRIKIEGMSATYTLQPE